MLELCDTFTTRGLDSRVIKVTVLSMQVSRHQRNIQNKLCVKLCQAVILRRSNLLFGLTPQLLTS